ncbi:unnamed protein product [Rotaria sp. Silwood1]|nr:unnamed protein product [Rotaria sp. Silwood1]
MAAPTGAISAPLGPSAPSSADTAAAAAATSSSPKSMEQLMNEIDQLKKDVDTTTKTLEKIDTGRKKAAANRDRSVEGRTQIRDLNERLINLQKQIDAMTKDSDPKFPVKKFDKTKKSALKTLSSLSKDLNQVDKHLERATGTIPATTTSTGDLQPAATPADGQPVAAPRVSTETENTKGVGALMRKLPFGGKKKSSSKKSHDTTTPTATEPIHKTDDAAEKKTKDEARSDTEEEEDEEEDEEDEEEESDDDDVVSDKKKVPEKSPRLLKKTEPIIINRKKIEVSDEESDLSEDDDEAQDDRQLLDELKSQTLTDENGKDLTGHGRRSRSPATPRTSKKTLGVKTDLIPSSSPKIKKPTTIISSPIPTHKKIQSPKGRTEIPIVKKKRDDESEEEEEEDSYFEEEDEEELRHLREPDDHEEYVSDHDYDEQKEEEEEEQPTLVNAYVQELRTNKYLPGTQFIVIQDSIGEQTGDLTIHKNDILTLVEQRSDDWWLFKNIETQQQGLVPINLIHLLSKQQIRRRIKPTTSAITLVNAFKDKNNIPTGFVPSDLAELSQIEQYQLWQNLIPKMTESNLAFTDLHWRADTDKLQVHDVIHQKILILKECVKIPRVKGEQIRVLDRCVRVCLYDGADVISNIHTVRALIPSKIDERDLTEDWHFVRNGPNTLIDEQPELLIRSNTSTSGQNLKLLMELSLWCQSTVTQEKCEIACGWSTVSIDDDEPPLITDTKNYNELLKGGNIDETNILLDPQYKILSSDGISGMIDRFKRARIKFSIESRESDVDLLYDNLPIQSIIVPINIIRPIVFFRNELACQLYKRQHPTNLSTTPIDSIFLSTFFQSLKQSDLIYTLNRLYSVRKHRYLTSSSSLQQQRKLFINTYELFIYPLLQYRQLPVYDFHDKIILIERKNLINDLIKRLLPRKKHPGDDILSLLLDPSLTDKWTPFTTDEISFSLQKYTHDFTNDIVA